MEASAREQGNGAVAMQHAESVGVKAETLEWARRRKDAREVGETSFGPADAQQPAKVPFRAAFEVEEDPHEVKRREAKALKERSEKALEDAMHRKDLGLVKCAIAWADATGADRLLLERAESQGRELEAEAVIAAKLQARTALEEALMDRYLRAREGLSRRRRRRTWAHASFSRRANARLSLKRSPTRGRLGSRRAKYSRQLSHRIPPTRRSSARL